MSAMASQNLSVSQLWSGWNFQFIGLIMSNRKSSSDYICMQCFRYRFTSVQPLQWRHNERDGISNHQPHDCLLNRLFRRRSKKTSKLRVTGLCVGNSPVTGEFPAQRASNAENVSIWWCHHDNAMGYLVWATTLSTRKFNMVCPWLLWILIQSKSL